MMSYNEGLAQQNISFTDSGLSIITMGLPLKEEIKHQLQDIDRTTKEGDIMHFWLTDYNPNFIFKTFPYNLYKLNGCDLRIYIGLTREGIVRYIEIRNLDAESLLQKLIAIYGFPPLITSYHSPPASTKMDNDIIWESFFWYGQDGFDISLKRNSLVYSYEVDDEFIQQMIKGHF
jgi:hypothetical protein